MQPGRAGTSGLGVPLLPLARWVGWVAPVRPTHGVLVLSCPSAALRVCSVLGRWAPVHRCSRAVCCGASAVSWASWLLFIGVLARCVVLHVRCPGPLGSCSPVCVLCVVRVCHGWLCPSSSPPNFRFFFFFLLVFFLHVFFFGRKKEKTMYNGNPLNLDRFLEKLDDWGVTVTEDKDPADAEKYVFRRFRYRLPEVLQELYFVATKEGKIKTLKEAKKWLNEQERVDAPQVAAKRWKSVKIQHDGQEIRLRDWRDFRGQYTLFRRNVEDWNEGDEQARLLSMLPEAWIKRVTKEEAKRAKFNHTVKMMLPKEYHTNVVVWTRKNVARDVKRHSLRNALLITVSGDCKKTAMWRLDECDVSGQSIRLQAIPARMSCDEILEWVGEEVLKEYRNLHHTRGLRPGDRDVNYVGEGPGDEAAMDAAGADGDEALVDDDDDDEPAEMAVCAFVAHDGAGSNQGSWKPLQPG